MFGFRLLHTLLGLYSVLQAAAAVDTFGITQFYASLPGTLQWTSAHWNNGSARTVTYSDDTFDPANWTEDHSSGTNGFVIDGKGTMTMSGSGPRFHINSLDASKGSRQFFRDVEYTAYFMHKGSAGQSWGGMVVGLRSGPLGHASPGGNECDATTYYARFRNDGGWDFEKELKHPGSTVWSSSGAGKQTPLWGGSRLPEERWIGMKYIIYNSNSNQQVTLELYIDTVSKGTPVNGGWWQHVGTVIDSGNWASGDVSGCGAEAKSIILEGNGTVLMRTDGDTAVYSMVSVREIDPEGRVATYTPVRSSATLKTVRQPCEQILHINLPVHTRSYAPSLHGRLYTIRGECIRWYSAPTQGIYLRHP